MVIVVGGDAPIIDADTFMNQEQCDELMNGVCAEPTPDELAKAYDEVGNEFGFRPRTKIKHSLERLSHFCCGACSKWWSIGDWSQHDRKYMYCPWCGTLQEVVS